MATPSRRPRYITGRYERRGITSPGTRTPAVGLPDSPLFKITSSLAERFGPRHRWLTLLKSGLELLLAH